jgi:hypothetical protein
MKRILTIFLLATMCLCAHAQIAPIQTSEKPYELIGGCMRYWKSQDRYELYINSSNKYENKVVTFQLGKTPEQAVESLQNLKALYGQKDVEFELEGRKCYVYEDQISVYKRGDLEHTAGTYMIFRFEIDMAIDAILKRMNPSLTQ